MIFANKKNNRRYLFFFKKNENKTNDNKNIDVYLPKTK